MANFNIVDIDNWERKDYYNHYKNNVNCTYSLTANLDVTQFLEKCRKEDIKVYPALIYAVTEAVNSVQNLKFNYDCNGSLGYWDEVSASYPLFHKDDKTFTYIYTDYCDNFKEFYKNCTDDMEKYKDAKGICAKISPENSFTVSCLPWVSYTSFNLNIRTEDNYLPPIITWGKYFEQANKMLLPMTLQIHHAIADGYHSSLFFNNLQNILLSCSFF